MLHHVCCAVNFSTELASNDAARAAGVTPASQRHGVVKGHG